MNYFCALTRLGITFACLLINLKTTDAQTPFDVHITFDEPAFPTVNSTLSTGVTGGFVNVGAFNIINDTNGAELLVAPPSGDLADFSIGVSSAQSGVLSGATTQQWEFNPASFQGRFRAIHEHNGVVAANNPGGRLINSMSITFASHLNVTGMSIDFSSLNTDGLAWEGSIIEFLDASGNPFSATPVIADYLTTEAASPGGINGSQGIGNYVTAVTTSAVAGVGTDLTSDPPGGQNPDDSLQNNNNNSTSAPAVDSLSLDFLDVGLAPGTQISGIRWTTFLEDVRGVNNNGSGLSASLIDFSINGTITQLVIAVPQPGVVAAKPIIFVRDVSAINQAIRALPLGMAHRRISIDTARMFSRDVNQRSFRQRSAGMGSGYMGGDQLPVSMSDVYKADNLGKNPISPDSQGGKNPVYGAGGKSVPDSLSTLDDKSPIVASPFTGNPWSVFVGGDFADQNVGSMQRLASYDTQTYAGTLGVERQLRPHLSSGLALSYIDSHTRLGGLGTIDIDGSGLTAYLDAEKGPWYGGVSYTYGQLDHAIDRIAGNGSLARGDTDSDSHQFGLDLGYRFLLGKEKRIVTGPYLALDYLNGSLDGYSESGAAEQNLYFSAQDYHSLTSDLGWQISWAKDYEKVRIIPQFRASWGRENLNDSEQITARLSDTPFLELQNGTFRRAGNFETSIDVDYLEQDYLNVGAGIQFAFKNGLSVFLNYDRRLYRDYEETQYASAWVSFKF